MESVAERIGIKGRAIFWEHAEPFMDVDKPHQLELLRMDLAKQRKPAARAKSAVKKPAKESAKSKPDVKAGKKGSTGAKKTSTPTARTKLKAGK